MKILSVLIPAHKQLPGGVSYVQIVRPTFHLYFANSSAFKDAMIKLVQGSPGLRFLIIDAGGISNVDLSGLYALDELEIELDHIGVTMLLANVRGPLRKKAEAAGLLKRVGSEAVKAVEDVYSAKVLTTLAKDTTFIKEHYTSGFWG